MKEQDLNRPKRGLASLSPEGLEQLCDLIISRLEGRSSQGQASQARRRGFESLHPLHGAER
jgi:hypothetical protein